MTTKEQKQLEIQYSTEVLREALQACGPIGNGSLTIRIRRGSGMNDYLDLYVTQIADVGAITGRVMGMRPMSRWVTFHVANALGYRMSVQEDMCVGGYGYSKTHSVVTALSRLVGFPLYLDGDERSGWYGVDR